MLLIKKYEESMSQSWDNFVQNSNNGTIFHYRKFLNYHISRSFNDCSLCFYYQKELICVLPAVLQERKLVSHPGASYGGLIINNSMKFSVMYEIINLLDQYCAEHQIQSLFLVSPPSIYWDNYDASLEYIFEYNQYQSKEIYISHAAKLNQDLPFIEFIDKRKKRYIKSFCKNDEFKIFQHDNFDDALGKKFYKLLALNKEKYSTKPTHSLDELQKLKTAFKDKIQLFISKKNNVVVGGAVLFITNKNTSLVFYNTVQQEMRETQLATYQLYFCAHYSENLNLKYVDFGVSQQPEALNPLSPKKSLINFKEQFNALGVWRRAYQKDFNESE